MAIWTETGCLEEDEKTNRTILECVDRREDNVIMVSKENFRTISPLGSIMGRSKVRADRCTPKSSAERGKYST